VYDMTSMRADLEPVYTVVYEGATQEFVREHDDELIKIESSLHVFGVALTISPVLDSHQTERDMVPVSAAQSELLQVDQGPEFQK
jgi:hypothetical protein